MDIFAKAYDYQVPRQAAAAGLYPYFIPLSSGSGPEAVMAGRRVLMFGSNDYLGLTGHPEVKQAAARALEDLAHARARGARVLAMILGGASTCDAYHVTAPRPDGTAAAYCMELALADAGAATGDVSHVNAHGTGTVPGDAAEAEALWQVFGAAQPPVTSIKGTTGHSLGASGAIEAVASVMAIANRLLPPTAGHDTPDPEIRPLDVVASHPRQAPDGLVLSNSFGFGGHNGSLVIGPPP